MKPANQALRDEYPGNIRIHGIGISAAKRYPLDMMSSALLLAEAAPRDTKMCSPVFAQHCAHISGA